MMRAFRFRHLRLAALVAMPVASMLASMLAPGPAVAVPGDMLEYAVKATYLYKFAPFVEWPASAHDSPSSAIGLCIVGDDPFGATLSRAVAGQRLGERAFSVLRMRAVDPQARCHVMFLAGSDSQSIATALEAVRGKPVLTVTDGVPEPRARGIVDFVLVGGRVRFEIDAAAAAENGIAVSSKLLSLAVAVRGLDQEEPE